MLEAYKVFESLNDRCKYILRIIQENGPVTKLDSQKFFIIKKPVDPHKMKGLLVYS